MMANYYSTRPWRVAEPTSPYKTKPRKLKKPNKATRVRWAAVQPAVYPPLQQQHAWRKIPWLNLRGHWLDRAGFHIGTRYRIVVQNKKILLVVE